MEKPFGTDLESAIDLNAQVHETFDESQVFRIDHFLGKEAAQNILAFRFANGLFEPIWNRNFIDHVQIDIPETLGLDQRANFYESTGAYKDMVVTHLFQVLAFVAMEPPTALEPRAISEEKNKVFRSLLPIEPRHVVRGQFTGYTALPGRRARLRHRDVHRAGVRASTTGAGRACRSTCVPARRWPRASGSSRSRSRRRRARCSRRTPASARPVPTTSRSTSPTSRRCRCPSTASGPGRGCACRSCRCSSPPRRPSQAGDVLEAYERLILDAMRGDHTLFTTAEGIESLWDRSRAARRPAAGEAVRPGHVGPERHPPARSRPHAWRLPFEREWRAKK